MIRTVPPRARINGLVAGCVVATVEGSWVCGAHVGAGRVLLLRAGTDRFEELVVEHYLHLMLERMGVDPPADPSRVHQGIVVNGLGVLEASALGIDRFDTELRAGDLLLLCSKRFDLDDDEVARLARRTLDEGLPVEPLARAIEARSAAVFEPSEAHRAKDVAFAIVVSRGR